MNTLEDLYLLFNVDPLRVIDILQKQQLIPRNKRCPICQLHCVLIPYEEACLKHCFQCPSCRRERYRLTDGTFFASIRLPPKTVLYVLWLWACKTRSGVAGSLLGVPRQSVYQLYHNFRKICSWTLHSNNLDLLNIGGPGEVVQIDVTVCGPGEVIQIDESIIRKRKYHVGRLIPQQWVLGMYSTREKRGVLLYISNRDAVTLTELITKYVKPGTEVWTDCWKGYASLTNLGGVSPYIHKTVSSGRYFVDPSTGICSNMVEIFCNKMKAYCCNLGVSPTAVMDEHINQFMWFQIYGGKPIEVFDNLLMQISQRYPV